MGHIKLIYICARYTGAVVEGQVYKLLEYYQTIGVFSDIVMIQQYGSMKELSQAKEILDNYSFRKIYLNVVAIRPNNYFKNIKLLRQVLSEELTSSSVIHVRNNLLSSLVRKALPCQYKNTYILTEFRGLTVDELKVAHPHRLVDYVGAYCVKVPYAKLLLHWLYKDKYAHLTAVSPRFKEIISNKGVPQDRISVHPNIVSKDFIFSEEQRRTIREKYGISTNQPVAVFSSGEGGTWQKDSELLEVLINQGYVVFNLGRNRVERQGVINEFLPRSEMPNYLSAADVAVLWREDVPLNNVACPSKFGEFVVMGLYVIHNGTVAIAKDFIEKNDSGLIVSNIEQIKIDKSCFDLSLRKKRCLAGYEVFSVQRIAESYIQHYENKN